MLNKPAVTCPDGAVGPGHNPHFAAQFCLANSAK
jgi:hypothetical protein